MEPVYFFSVAAQQSRWLAVRQNAVAQNIANANTPRYSSVDVEPFEAVVKKTNLTLAATSSGHMSLSPSEAMTAKAKRSDSWSTVHSGNSVSIEQEMLKAGEINRNYQLNTNLVKSFHRMLMAASKG
ncbi:MAG: flagellar basal body rod protein FlgB [Bosea sp.]|uniref:flagellar basal body rod protein FlgB n=1 Tax=Bosea sp. (in: a-proteobacteria) TaxID=1871050 RepID=UPI002393509D|nr:flagellar basal body rod protein FlgB [Bosea sp. (in: a-proteobacteria)]MCP4738158.1 flagellar basal body rod protein FlgB [Bosea sp. (in: a-proteobacteria)]